jgi:hypothetical protein
MPFSAALMSIPGLNIWAFPPPTLSFFNIAAMLSSLRFS